MIEQNANLAALSAAGVSVWLDDLSRERLASGNLAELIATRSVVGVTTNPTIFAGALAQGAAYDAQVRELVAGGADVDAAVRALTTDDVRHACDVFTDVHTATGGKDGRVSIEVDPRLAHDTEKTATQAVELWETVDRPNAMIKIPATEAGLPAITATIAKGISVNVTLIFSVERYRKVMDAYLDGLDQAKANGHDLSSIGSVASFFVSRVDTEVDTRLDAIGTPEVVELKSKAILANARLAYGAYEQVFQVGPRWQELAAAGHAVRLRAGGAEHRQHHAGEDDGRLRRPRRGHRRHGQRHRRGRAGGLRRDLVRRRRPHGRLPHPRERGRQQVRGVLGRAAGDRAGTAQRRCPPVTAAGRHPRGDEVTPAQP